MNNCVCYYIPLQNKEVFMSYRDLRDYIKILENKRLIHRVTTEVDPILEISEITDRMCKSEMEAKRCFSRRSGVLHSLL